MREATGTCTEDVGEERLDLGLICERQAGMLPIVLHGTETWEPVDCTVGSIGSHHEEQLGCVRDEEEHDGKEACQAQVGKHIWQYTDRTFEQALRVGRRS